VPARYQALACSRESNAVQAGAKLRRLLVWLSSHRRSFSQTARFNQHLLNGARFSLAQSADDFSTSNA
jgi:hypothetical protein